MDSIVNQQTKYKFLVIVINDGSPDSSREKLRKYEGLDNVVIIDQENKGFSGARNTGLKHIKAKYVTFVDSDDRMMPGAIEAMMEDAMTLGLSMTAQFYDMFLRQVRMNYNRISTLHDSSIDRHVFVATCRAKRQNFPTEHTSNPYLKPIERALDEHNFGNYRVLCSIL